jgi:arginyl-tRNA synthetase
MRLNDQTPQKVITTSLYILYFAIVERLEADASRSRESLTPPSLNPAYKIEINHDKDDDSGDLKFNLLFELARTFGASERERKIEREMEI